MSMVATLIREHREEKDMSQMELAKALGYDYPQNISYYESGKRQVPRNKLHLLCEILDIHTDAMLDAYLGDIKVSIQMREGL